VELEEIMTAVATGIAESGFTYSGTGSRRYEGTGTEEMKTSGSKIVSYSESETETIDRTLNVEIPDGCETNEWNIVDGTGTSGGNRMWNFKFLPEQRIGEHHSGLDDVGCTSGRDYIFGEWTLKESVSGFYSDHYEGKEFFDVTVDESCGESAWKLLSGSGSGNGNTSYTKKLSLDGNVSLKLYDEVIEDDYGCQIAYIRHDSLGSYDSSLWFSQTQNFDVDIFVENGVWKNHYIGSDRETSLRSYKIDASGDYTHGTSGIVISRTEKGSSTIFTSTRNDWEIQNGITTSTGGSTLTATYEEMSYINKHYASSTSYILYDFGQTLWHTDYTSTKPGQNAVTTHAGGGVIHGMRTNYISSNGMTTHDTYQQFEGKIIRDSQTGMFSGSSTAITSSYSSIGFPLPESHGERAIAYNYFTNLQGGEDQNANCNRVVWDFSFPLQYEMPSPESYHSALQLTFGEEGLGVSLNQTPVAIPPDIFDSGISQYLPEIPPPVYEPWQNYTTPVDPTYLNTGITMWWEFEKAWYKGEANIIIGVAKNVQELGCMTIDTVLGTITAASLLTGHPVVFDAWSSPIQALESGDISTGGYYANTIPNIATFGVYGQGMGVYNWWNGYITDAEMQEQVGGTAIFQLIPAGMKYGPKLFIKSNTIPQNFNYTNTVRNHLNNPNRFVPQEIIRGVIQDGISTPDPQGTSATMHYSTLFKNGAKYNIEVLYDSQSNTILHVMYTRAPRGPLPAIPK